MIQVQEEVFNVTAAQHAHGEFEAHAEASELCAHDGALAYTPRRLTCVMKFITVVRRGDISFQPLRSC